MGGASNSSLATMKQLLYERIVAVPEGSGRVSGRFPEAEQLQERNGSVPEGSGSVPEGFPEATLFGLTPEGFFVLICHIYYIRAQG